MANNAAGPATRLFDSLRTTLNLQNVPQDNLQRIQPVENAMESSMLSIIQNTPSSHKFLAGLTCSGGLQFVTQLLNKSQQDPDFRKLLTRLDHWANLDQFPVPDDMAARELHMAALGKSWDRVSKQIWALIRPPRNSFNLGKYFDHHPSIKIILVWVSAAVAFLALFLSIFKQSVAGFLFTGIGIILSALSSFGV